MATRDRTPQGESRTEFFGERELIVVATPEAGLRAIHAEVASVGRADVSAINRLLKKAGATIAPLFGSEERVRRTIAMLPTEMAASIPDLSTYYRVYAANEQLDQLAEDLLEQKAVASAYVKPASSPPIMPDSEDIPPSQEAPPVTPDFTPRQLYLEAAPGGIDARFAWTRPGGRGQGVRIIDIEGAWRFSHEDLLQNQGGVIGGTQSTDIRWRDHGTAVVGEFGGDVNTFGITGICPEANVRAISIFGASQGSAKSITDAANALTPGDIILIELHRPGPRFNFQQRSDQAGYIAVEWWPDDLAAIVFATSVRGVIVVEAAGNGAENLNDALYDSRPAGFPTTWRNPFNLANPQSGAIVVGAGAPPSGTHGRDHGPDRSRLDFSNHGARVDVQGWGREVTTTGYGDLQGGTNEDLWYTDQFSGTSSASPIVVGAVGCMQGGLRAKSKPLLTPASARAILRNTGSAQQDAPGRPATQRIGNRPNLRQAFQQLALDKALVKEVKEPKEFKENKEVKEKDIKELKDQRKEGKEFKEKEIKERTKDFKDLLEKRSKDFKEKDIFEGRPTTAATPDLDSRLGQLEETVALLTHFITAELRPDLQSSALGQEPDLLALSSELEKQATDAKAAKENKDAEKLRDS